MAAKAAGDNAAVSSATAKVPVVTVLIATMLGVWLGLGGAAGGVYYLVKSGKLQLPAMGSGGATSASVQGEGAHTMVLEPILVNLADPGGHAYLRLGLTLNLDGESAKPEGGGESKTGKGPTEQELAVRDTVLAVLGQQTSTWLLGPDGKEHLKVELEEAIAKHNPQVRVKDVFFTDFLVQI
jgi:flagellar FliL protein